jgi:hypothetical protein
MIGEFSKNVEHVISYDIATYIAGLLLLFIALPLKCLSLISLVEITTPSTPSLEYFGPHVKHLIIGGRHWEYDSLTKFLGTCHNLVDLALWTHIPTREFLPIFEMLSLNKLSTNLAGLTFDELTSPTFASITHLALNKGPGDPGPDGVVHRLLRGCQRLKSLLIVQNIEFWNLETVPLNDARLVLMKIERYVCEDWVKGARGNEDMWRCAEEISRAKRGNLLEFLFEHCSFSYRISDGFFKDADTKRWFSRYGYRGELFKYCGYPKQVSA